MRLSTAFSALAACLALCASVALAAVSEQVSFYRSHPELHGGLYDIMIPMRDGVKLSTVVILPVVSEAKHAAVMDRSPYGHFGTELLTGLFLGYGYAAIGQDMRGTGKSEGLFTMWRSDANDAYDTMAYIAKQKWSNGKVYQFGLSADGIATFVLGTNPHPALAGQSLLFASGDPYKTVFPGGSYVRSLIHDWIHKTVVNQTHANLVIRDAEANEAPSSWWDSVNITGHWDNFKNPSVVWAGWYDIFLDGSITGFNNLQKLTGPGVAGNNYIVVDPLGHCQDAASAFPSNLIMGRALLPIQMAMWNLGSRTSPVPQGVDKVTFYVMTKGAVFGPGNYWTTLPEWPKYEPTEFFLSHEKALSADLPRAPGNATYVYDPASPMRTKGGHNLFISCGPLEQDDVDSHPNAMIFTTPALTKDFAVTGPVMARLFVSTSANDTDFVAKLEDVAPNGRGSLIVDGVVRLRWRNGGTLPQFVQPDEVNEVTVSMLPTAYIFPKGHRIRLVVSSSSYPRFDVNYNNGLPLSEAHDGPKIVATNRILFGADTPSALILPQVQKSQIPPHRVGADMGPEMASVCELLAKAGPDAKKLTFMGSNEVPKAFAEACAINKLFF